MLKLRKYPSSFSTNAETSLSPLKPTHVLSEYAVLSIGIELHKICDWGIEFSDEDLISERRTMNFYTLIAERW